jgi:hypothetical protein
MISYPSGEVPFTEEQMKAFAGSQEGRRLMALLSRDGGAAFRRAAGAYRAGDFAAAQQTLGPLLETPEAAALLAKLSGKQAENG